MTKGKSRRGKTTPYPLEWERARVERWVQLIAANPMSYRLQIPGHSGGSQSKRKAEFEERYAILEAEVPTPVDA